MNFSFLTKSLACLLIAGTMLAQKQPQPKGPKELAALQAIFAIQEPAARIAAVEDFLGKFAESEFKGTLLQVAAMSAQQQNDFEKTVIYSERTLEADPKNYTAMLMLANSLASRTKEFDLDKEEKLKKAEGHANSALEIIKTAAKPRPDITDEQWEGARKDFNAQAYEALGLAAMVRKNYAMAAQQFKASIDSGAAPEASTMVRLAAAYNQLGKPDEAVAMLDKLNAMPDVNPAIKSVAQSERNNATKLKGGGAKPAAATPPPAAPAPAQVEVKK